MTIKKRNNTFLKDLLGGANDRGDSGQAELLFIFMTFTFLSLMALFSYKMILHYKMNQQRQRAYLCIKESFETHNDAKDYLQFANYGITTAYAILAASGGSAAVHVSRAISALKKLHVFIIMKSFWDIYRNPNCTKEQSLILIAMTPASVSLRRMRVNRDLLGYVNFRNKKQNFIYPSQSIMHSDFIIKGKVHYTPKFILTKTKEYNLDILDPINHAALKAQARSLFFDFKSYFRNPSKIIEDFVGIMI